MVGFRRVYTIFEFDILFFLFFFFIFIYKGFSFGIVLINGV